jgi:pimeloyl-ACP methyl ester carboxylesterase
MNLTEFRAGKQRLKTVHGDIAYADLGDGPVIVLLHGVPLNSAHWRGVVGQLRDRFRCIAPDLLGLGDTERRQSSGLDFPSQAQMVLDVLDQLGVRSFHLVGNDSGGAIAQILACRPTQRLLSLTLTNCDVDANVPPPAFAQAFALAKAGLFSRALADMRNNLALARSDFGLGVGFENPQHITPELVEAYIAPLLSSSARESDFNHYVAAFDNAHTIALREKLTALNTPTQLLWASSDVFFPRADAVWLAQTIPGFRRLIDVEGARLFFCEERPDWVAARIAEFISSLQH